MLFLLWFRRLLGCCRFLCCYVVWVVFCLFLRPLVICSVLLCLLLFRLGLLRECSLGLVVFFLHMSILCLFFFVILQLICRRLLLGSFLNRMLDLVFLLYLFLRMF